MKDAPLRATMRSILLDMVPALTVIAMILMMVIPNDLPSVIRIGGVWPLIGIAYWTLVRPRNMVLGMGFALGLLVDIVTFTPLGLHAFVFILTQLVLRKQRRFLLGQGFWVLWAAFALLAISVYAALFVLAALFQLPSGISFTTGLIGVGIAWTCMPPVIWILSNVHETIDLFDDPAA